ncbi:MAG TPA: hypothetical protein VMZ52_07650 [Bryobacteraceae bacterium]|nr:hypothetical protein [Bryobacteraceae bacterium]
MWFSGLVLFVAFALLASAAAVKQQAVLRSGCEAQDNAVATIPADTPVEIRFAISGSAETCYKVSSTVAGSIVQGYLPASALSALDDFQEGRRNAAVIDFSPAMQALPGSTNGGQPIARASQLLQQKQPRAALETAEAAIKTQGRDYQLLLLSGIAAYETDDAPRALAYLKEAELLKQDHLVEQWVATLEKEVAGDKSGARLYGNRFLVRYEGANMPVETVRSLLAVLDGEFNRVSQTLGCHINDRIPVVFQSKQAYLASTYAAEWSGGQFDGSKIRIPLSGTNSGAPDTRRALAHEVVHVCLASLGQWPAWLHEGMAQKLSADSVSSGHRAGLRNMVRQGRMPKLGSMSQSWSRMSAQHAALAYAQSLLAVDLMMDRYAAYGIQNILRNPDRLPGITTELDALLLQ